MVSHPETDSDPPIGSDRESGRDRYCSHYRIIKCVGFNSIHYINLDTTSSFRVFSEFNFFSIKCIASFNQ